MFKGKEWFGLIYGLTFSLIFASFYIVDRLFLPLRALQKSLKPIIRFICYDKTTTNKKSIGKSAWFHKMLGKRLCVDKSSFNDYDHVEKR